MPTTRLIMPHARRRSTRFMRTVRVLLRDSSALWREFQMPIIVFLLALFGGGFVYGELLVRAGYARVPYIDLPYMMLGLMLLQPPGDIPPQPELILFWYVLPALAVYIVGRGASDFVRLFFNRSERRAAWEEAVASTYRNHVIIMGVGHVGLRVARTLAAMGFEVVGIDHSAKPDVEQELSDLGVPLIIADGRSQEILEKAGLRYAQSFLACTSSDQTNLEAVMRARDLNPSIRIVSRIWDSQFANQMKRFMDVQSVLSASDLAAPVFAGSAVGIEITQTLHINGIDYSMIRLQVESGSFLDGDTIGQLQTAHDMDIVLHGHDGNVEVQPDHAQNVKSGDTLVIFARHDKVINIVERNRYNAARKN
ncbi:MAG: TrkA family potassium uptake protein [Chloroflexota bacterium]